jgi:hypothetical protein
MPDTLLDLDAAVDDARMWAEDAIQRAGRLCAADPGSAALAEVSRRLVIASAALADALAPVAGAVAAEKRAWGEAQRGGGAVPMGRMVSEHIDELSSWLSVTGQMNELDFSGALSILREISDSHKNLLRTCYQIATIAHLAWEDPKTARSSFQAIEAKAQEAIARARGGVLP